MNVIWIPGWGYDATVWSELITRLPAWQHSVVAVNSIHGTASFVPYIQQQMAGEPVVLIGWSMGGMLAIDIALRYPDLVAAVVCISGTTQFVNPDTRYGWPDTALTTMRERLHRQPAETVAAFVRSMFNRSEIRDGTYAKFLDRFPVSTTTEFDEIRIQALDSGLNYLRSFDVSDSIHTATVPILWIHGDSDIICPTAQFERMREQLRDSANHHFELMANTSHVPFFRHCDAVAEKICAFLRQSDMH